MEIPEESRRRGIRAEVKWSPRALNEEAYALNSLALDGFPPARESLVKCRTCSGTHPPKHFAGVRALSCRLSSRRRTSKLQGASRSVGPRDESAASSTGSLALRCSCPSPLRPSSPSCPSSSGFQVFPFWPHGQHEASGSGSGSDSMPASVSVLLYRSFGRSRTAVGKCGARRTAGAIRMES